MTTSSTPEDDRAAAAWVPRDHGLVAAVMAEVAFDGSRPWLPVPEVATLARALAARPGRLAGHAGRHLAELVRIGAGTSPIEPNSDRRFRDPAWVGNPGLRRVAQSYLAWCGVVHELIAEAELDWRGERRLRLAANNVLDALAPTNNPALNPVVLKAALDSGGLSLARGAGNLAADILQPGVSPRLPALVDRGAFAVGTDIAATPGAVVARTEMFELIQYAPATATVRQHPLVIVPSTINKFYVFDLAPGRSVIEHAVGSGQQVFALSWRNPGPEHAQWDLAAYASCVVDALALVREIAGADRTHVAGLCAGGVIAAVALAHLAATGSADRIASATFVVTVLDHERAGDLGALLDERAAEMAIEETARRGYVDGEALAGVFAWLRPHDRLWRYWIHNYLLGRQPSAQDLLFWNADTVNLAAGMHRDLLELAVGNALARPGGLERLGTPLDLGAITADAFYVAGLTDHLTPWESALRSARLLGGEAQFALVNSGHVTSVVAVPGDARGYWSRPVDAELEAEAWLAGAPARAGSWWHEWIAWLDVRGGARRRARRTLGSRRHRPLGPAPGRYVRA